uniref:Peptidylprolyl isomerase n=1 Tax=Phenylobacterium glaciei TaxID=2803784 RepID=A0A974P4I6_9CAUL|nr:peptidylprolyl isomerase [Phenylobacterium glaciei]
MAPAMAPQSVARVTLLAREGVYDGLQFHRVIEGFVNQTGNPNNKDGGTSSHPDLPLEATFKLKMAGYRAVAAPTDGTVGFLGTVPIQTVSGQEALRSKDGTVRAWAPIAPASPGWGGRRARTPATARSSSCADRADGWTATMRSGAGSWWGRTSTASSRWENRRPSPT